MVEIFEDKSGNYRTKHLIIIFIIFVVGFVLFVAYKLYFDSSIGDPAEVFSPHNVAQLLDMYQPTCDFLCPKYGDSELYNLSSALKYCEKYFVIDINLNRNSHVGNGESGTLRGFGLCEDRVYCFNINDCRVGSGKNDVLTHQKCKEIMCEYYLKDNGGDNLSAASIIQEKIQFGSCSPNDPGISFTDSTGISRSLALWYTGTFKNVNCPGTTG